ncbi:MAG: YokU family protein [Bacillaceae bacterium]
MNCHWCDSAKVNEIKSTVYWELPDGTNAISIEETPTVCCSDCGMEYQEEAIIEEIENQLFLIDTKKLAKVVTYDALMTTERILKRNYFAGL